MARVLQTFHFTYWDWIRDERVDVPAGTVVNIDGNVNVTIVTKGVFPETPYNFASCHINIPNIRGSAETQIRYTTVVAEE